MKRCISHAVPLLIAILSGMASSADLFAQDWSLDKNRDLVAYLESKVAAIEKRNELTSYPTREAWEADKPTLRSQLFDMLGLDPLPVKTPLNATITGVVEESDFKVERVHFQSLPGLYVTGNLYLPKSIDGPLPTILYLCGHALVKKGETSFGNKTAYHHHGAWFARNGYACLTIDSLQLGEIEGVHHGTYRMNRWWWNVRGYTPAGVEAWNCMRAIDYLETRKEVDASRFGATGRSGGGAYSWWIAALDERIRCAVPVAGITSMHNHVIDGCVEGHCDCMFMVNAYQWDFAKVAALVAPRPLLISNTDKDTIFPLEGVVDIHRQVRHIYRLHDASASLGLHITEGPHEDTQELHLHAFRWFNRFLKNDKSLIDKAAHPFFEPEQLRVFESLPADEVNTRIDRSFVPAAAVTSKESILEAHEAWNDQEGWFTHRMTQLRDRCFRAWPDEASPPAPADFRVVALPIGSGKTDDEKNDQVKRGASASSMRHRVHFESEQHVPLWFDVIHHRDTPLAEVTSARMLVVADCDAAIEQIAGNDLPKGEAVLVFCPRGAGPHRWAGNEAKQIHIRRRFQLIGTTVDSMRVWDIRRAIHVANKMLPPRAADSLALQTDAPFAMHGIIARLFEPSVKVLRLDIQAADLEHPIDVLNLTRTVSLQELAAMCVWRGDVSMAAEPTTIFPLAAELTSDTKWRGKSITQRR